MSQTTVAACSLCVIDGRADGDDHVTVFTPLFNLSLLNALSFTNNISSAMVVTTARANNGSETGSSMGDGDSAPAGNPPVTEFLQYIYTFNMAIICGSLCLFGMTTNILNIIVFMAMKFKETINIALMGLAISDFISLTFLLWTTICYNPLFMHSELPIISLEIQYRTGSWTHIIFTRITTFITVYITLERCLCIAFPLKIKRLLTPPRVLVILICIYVVITVTLSVNYYNFRLDWKYVPELNRSVIGIVYKSNRYITQTVGYLMNVIYIMVSFFSVVICTCILIWKLKQRSKFLSGATATTTTDQAQDSKSKASSRDGQVIKMVVSVAVIFIVSYTPSVLLLFTMAVEVEFNMGKKYHTLWMVLATVIYNMNAFNSGVNIFVYLKMSSKFLSTFNSVICRSKTSIK